MYIYIYIYIYIYVHHLSFCLSVCLSVYLSIYLPIYLFICIYTYLFIYLSYIYIYTYVSFHPGRGFSTRQILPRIIFKTSNSHNEIADKPMGTPSFKIWVLLYIFWITINWKFQAGLVWSLGSLHHGLLSSPPILLYVTRWCPLIILVELKPSKRYPEHQLGDPTTVNRGLVRGTYSHQELARSPQGCWPCLWFLPPVLVGHAQVVISWLAHVWS